MVKKSWHHGNYWGKPLNWSIVTHIYVYIYIYTYIYIYIDGPINHEKSCLATISKWLMVPNKSSPPLEGHRRCNTDQGYTPQCLLVAIEAPLLSFPTPHFCGATLDFPWFKAGLGLCHARDAARGAFGGTGRATWLPVLELVQHGGWFIAPIKMGLGDGDEIRWIPH